MPSPRVFRQLGILILAVGFISAGTVYWLAVRHEAEAQRKAQLQGDEADAGLSPDDSKRYAHNSESNMGKEVMVIDRFLHSVDQWFQGTNLAFMLVAGAAILGIGCFAIADRSPPK